MSGESFDSITTSNHRITPKLIFYGAKTRVNFSGGCLMQDKVTYIHGIIVNIYIVYEISKHYSISLYPTLENCLFAAVSLTKNADIDKYKYSGYGIGFDRHGEFSFGTRGFGRNCIIFGADLSSSSHVNNKSLHYNGVNSYLVVNGTEIYKFKAKDSEIVASPLCLGNISKDVSVNNKKKKTGLYGYVYDFSVDYDAIAVDDILDIHKYIMGKNV